MEEKMKKQKCHLMCLFNELNKHPCEYIDCDKCGLRVCTTRGHYKTCSCFRNSYNGATRESRWIVLSRDVYNGINIEEFPAPMKRQKTHSVVYKPAQVKCSACQSCVCFDAYNKYSSFTEPDNFEPQRANLYTEKINKQALLLYWIRRHCSPNLPNGILEMILKYII